MVLTQEVEGGGDGPPLKVSETIVRNLRVLATDQRIDSKDEDGKTEVKTFSNVTFEVTPRIAEKIAVAQSWARCRLSLRSIADNTAELERAVASGEVKVPAGTNPAEERQMLLAVANRRRQPTRPSRPAATCRASSAAASPVVRRRRAWRFELSARTAMARRAPAGNSGRRGVAGPPVRSCASLAATSHRRSGGSSLR
jgi:Flp pilus assembly protein CpaB